MNWKTLFAISSLPLFAMIYGAETGYYGVDAGKGVVHTAGWWGVIFLTLTLSATPLLRVFRKRILMQHRRQLGLWTFFYSAVHLSFYLLFLLESLNGLLADIVKRPYITVGFVAVLILTALAITSTKGWQRSLKKNWLRLHQLVYVVAVLVIVHWWMTLRSDYAEWLTYSLPLVILLGYRIYKRIKK